MGTTLTHTQRQQRAAAGRIGGYVAQARHPEAISNVMRGYLKQARALLGPDAHERAVRGCAEAMQRSHLLAVAPRGRETRANQAAARKAKEAPRPVCSWCDPEASDITHRMCKRHQAQWRAQTRARWVARNRCPWCEPDTYDDRPAHICERHEAEWRAEATRLLDERRKRLERYADRGMFAAAFGALLDGGDGPEAA